MNNPRTGSTVDSLWEELGISEEVEKLAKEKQDEFDRQMKLVKKIMEEHKDVLKALGDR